MARVSRSKMILDAYYRDAGQSIGQESIQVNFALVDLHSRSDN